MTINVIKKDGTISEWQDEKIKTAVSKAASRVGTHLSTLEMDTVIERSKCRLDNLWGETSVTVSDIHKEVTRALGEVNPSVQKSYQDYRDYKTSFVKTLDEIFVKTKDTLYFGDRENANFDSSLISTKGSIIRGYLTKELYKNFYLSQEELQLIEDGFIYIHDIRDLIFGGFNCCTFDIEKVLKGGFEMSGIQYQEPKTVLSALQVIGDVVLSATAQQFGGFTLPELDRVLVPYVIKSYKKYEEEADTWGIKDTRYPARKVEEELSQGFQSLEMKLNTVPCSRGDFAFTTISFGNLESSLNNPIEYTAQYLTSKAILKTRMAGQGKNHKPVVFPKLVYLHSEQNHQLSFRQQRLFNLAVDCCSKAMYPDFLDIDQAGDVARIYNESGVVISPMGCVDGDETVTVVYKGNLYNKSFSDLWELVSKDYDIQSNGVTSFVETSELFVKDIDGSFTKVKVLLQNPDAGNWKLLKFSNGRSLVCTADHPLPVEGRGRTFVQDMILGDKVMLEPLTEPNNQGGDDEYDADTAWMHGLVLCDGAFVDNLRVSLGSDELDIAESLLLSLGRAYPHLSHNVVQQERGERGSYTDIVTKGKGVGLICKGLQSLFAGVKKVDRRIPDYVMNSTRYVRAAFMAGMIDADGYYNSNGILQIGSTNKVLALQQMNLLQSLGCKAKIYLNKYNKAHAKYRYRVEAKVCPDVTNFMKSLKKVNNVTTRYKDVVCETATLVDVVDLGFTGRPSYDVTTESDTFCVSGLCSHNCRSYLSEFKDESGQSISAGRANVGVVSLNLPMIVQEFKNNPKGAPLYESVIFYLDKALDFLNKRYDVLADMPCSSNPLAFTQGGMYKGTKQPDERIGQDIVEAFTASIGITALDEVCCLLHGVHLHEATESQRAAIHFIVDLINQHINVRKEKDGRLYGLYGTPAESLCGTQLKQFRERYGIIPQVSDKEYFTNSFHVNVAADVTPLEKQNLEEEFFHSCAGGHIIYSRLSNPDNKTAIKTLVKRGMSKGFYQGVNFDLAICEHCHQRTKTTDECDNCGSDKISVINRVCGYLGWTKLNGESRMNDAKLAEIQDRKCM